jgi:hypothetical protein
MFKYRVVYFIVLLASIAFYLFYSGYLSFFTMAAVLLLPLASRVMTMIAVHHTRVRFDIKEPCVGKEEDIVLDIVFENHSIFPIAQAGMTFCCTNSLCGESQQDSFFMPVGARTEQAAEYGMKSKYCGKIVMELSSVNCYDYLGIFTLKRKTEAKAEAFVLPQIQPLDIEIDTAVNFYAESNTYSAEKPGDDPSEIFDIRPYRSGDSLKSIHWKLSSKADELMVKEFSMPMDSSVLLLAELMAPTIEALDLIVETLISLSRFLLENRISHCVQWYDARNNLLRKSEIKNESDSAELLNAILSAQRYRDEASALLSQDPLSGNIQNSPHVIYITGELTEAITDFCNRPCGDKTTVLFCGKPDEKMPALIRSASATKIQVITIQPGAIQKSLSGLLL